MRCFLSGVAAGSAAVRRTYASSPASRVGEASSRPLRSRSSPAAAQRAARARAVSEASSPAPSASRAASAALRSSQLGQRLGGARVAGGDQGVGGLGVLGEPVVEDLAAESQQGPALGLVLQSADQRVEEVAEGLAVGGEAGGGVEHVVGPAAGAGGAQRADRLDGEPGGAQDEGFPGAAGARAGGVGCGHGGGGALPEVTSARGGSRRGRAVRG
ncbi:hypothetical protein ACFQVA_26080 [Actinomadura keratinilytica]